MQQVRELVPNVYWVGALNATLRVFDIIMRTESGTTYNAYLVKGEKTALIDAVHESFAPEFLAKVSSLVPLEELDYLIVNHTEMDHSGSIAMLLERAPQLEVLGTRSALHLLRNIVNAEFRARAVQGGETLDLGCGKRLTFLSSPFWHWPDTMFTYLEDDGILFSCDGFAAHYCDERLFDDRVGDFSVEAKYYFGHIQRPFKDKVPPTIAKVRALPKLSMIAPSHGPLRRANPMAVVDQWEAWSAPVRKDRKEVAILYCSAYGATRDMARHIALGIEAEGAAANMADVAGVDIYDAVDAMERAEGVLFGSPTLNGDALKPVWDCVALTALIVTKGKVWGTFGSYGWSGEATKLLDDRLKGLKLRVALEPLRAVLIPSVSELEACEAFGRSFAQAL